MKPLWRKASRLRRFIRQVIAAGAGPLLAAPVFAQGNSPWENAVNVLQQAFTSTIARGLPLVAIVVAGLTFAFGEGGSSPSPNVRQGAYPIRPLQIQPDFNSQDFPLKLRRIFKNYDETGSFNEQVNLRGLHRFQCLPDEDRRPRSRP